jgi:transposase InsO family protein
VVAGFQVSISGRFWVSTEDHTDRDTQYLSMPYTDRLTEVGIEPWAVAVGAIRMTTALAESVIGLFKTEVIQRKGPWRHLEAVEFATLPWVDWFNTRRLLEPIGYVPPAEYEARNYSNGNGTPRSRAWVWVPRRL